MELKELEARLAAHSKAIKAAITPPFSINELNELDERIDKNLPKEEEIIPMTMERTTKKPIKTILLAAAFVAAMSATAFAAYQYLTAGEVAEQLGDKKLAAQLAGSDFAPQTMTDGPYRATVLGVVSGENISDFQPDTWDVAPGNTYAVVAVEKTDGTPMTFDDEILVTPLIQGQTPWQYNIFTMYHGSAQMQIVDGVLYRIVEFDDIQCFADRQVYLAVLGEAFLDNSSYQMDEATGVITPKADYDGCNILFTLPLDPKKADPQKAEQILKAIDAEMARDDGDDGDNANHGDVADGDISFQVDNANMEDVEVRAGEDFEIDKNSDPNEGIIVHQKEFIK
ncbi:MAG: hypothetical protein HFI72_05565 [Peptococcaceae bacterium]|jgi:hypothetical protein|nr:hypothetical protein [Peptococcaceae bacterium]